MKAQMGRIGTLGWIMIGLALTALVLFGAWRWALAFGCAANLVTLPWRLWLEESEAYQADRRRAAGLPASTSCRSRRSWGAPRKAGAPHRL